LAASAIPATTALAETINGLYKAELIHRRARWRSFEAVEFATLEWVWFNNRRLLEPISRSKPSNVTTRYWTNQPWQREMASDEPGAVHESLFYIFLWSCPRLTGHRAIVIELA
jgi:hypothetical protein